MKGNYRIWLTMALILIAGVGATTFTGRFVSRRETNVSAAADTNTAVTAESEAAAGQPGPPQAGGRIAAENASMPASGSGAGALAEGSGGESATVAIPPVGIPAQSSETSENMIGIKTRHELRLEELDAQIAQYRLENQDSTSNAMKVNAEYELRMWETEMDLLLDALSTRLHEDKYEDLQQEQREWSKEMEARAVEASRKYAGSALEGVEYTVSLAAQTRDRVYTIVSGYRQILEVS